MRRAKLWIGAGVVTACLGAGLVGQKVLGQLDVRTAPAGANYPPPSAGRSSLPIPRPQQQPGEPAPFPLGDKDLPPVQPTPPVQPRIENGPRQVQAIEPLSPPPNFPSNPAPTGQGVLPLPTNLGTPPSAPAPYGSDTLPPAGTRTFAPIDDPRMPTPKPNMAPTPPLPAPGLSEPGLREPGLRDSGIRETGLRDPGLPEPGLVPERPVDTVSGTDIRASKNEPAVSIEWVAPPTARLNQPLPCQILVKNISTATVHQVVVRHALASGVTHRSSEPAASVSDRQLTWQLGSLEPGQARRIDLQLVSQARGNMNCQATVTFTGSSSAQVLVREPLLNVKVTGPSRVVVDEIATFGVTLANPGDGPTENIRLRVALSEGLEHTRGRTFEVDAGQLAAKETRAMQLRCKVCGGGPQQVTLTASADAGLTSTDTANLEVLLPKLNLAVAGPKLRYVDRHAVYALKVANPGSAPATQVTLTETVPAGFKFHAASGAGKFDDATRTVTWALGDVIPGQSREVNLELVAAAPGDHKLVGHVVSARGVRMETETQTRVEGVSSLILEMVDAEDPVEVGAHTTYEIRVSNAGSKTETNLTLICTLPEQLEFRDARCGAGQRFRVEGRDLIFEPVAKLAPRADVIYRVQVRGRQPGNVRFRAQVRADGLVEPVMREEVTRIYNDDVVPR